MWQDLKYTNISKKISFFETEGLTLAGARAIIRYINIREGGAI